MEEITELTGMLELMSDPCFCAKGFRIVKVNQEASRLFLREGMDLMPMLSTGVREYSDFSGGCLYLNLEVCGVITGASVVRIRDFDCFVLDRESSCRELQALALAAQHLREPLTSLVMGQEQLRALTGEHPALADPLNHFSRSLAQLQRIVGNMSDAYSPSSRQECQNLTALFREIVEKAQALVSQIGVTLTYESTREQILSLADAQELERAILNLLSNALKHTPAGGTVAVTFQRQGRMVFLQIRDSGSGIASEVMGSVFRRFQRQPGIESAGNGIGLGMVLVRTAAVHHGGTVLIDQPEGQGTRVTMTLAIRQNNSSALRSPILRVDYAGGRDHTLLELSDVLPPQLFSNE